MRATGLIAAGLLVVSMSAAQAAPIAADKQMSAPSDVIQVQSEKPKKGEPVKDKVKRAWRNMTGTKFAVACPAFPVPLTRTTCTETGSKADARAKCQAKHPLCSVAEAK